MRTVYILGWYVCWLQCNGRSAREIYPVIAITKKFMQSDSSDTVSSLTISEWEIFREALMVFNANAQFGIR